MRTHRFISAGLLLTAAMGVAGPCPAQLLELTKQQFKIMDHRAPDFMGTGNDGEQIRLGGEWQPNPTAMRRTYCLIPWAPSAASTGRSECRTSLS